VVKIESVDREKKRLSLVPAVAGTETVQHNEGNEDYRRYLGKETRSMGTLGDALKSSGLAGKRKK
jgi:hypothetical protein